MGAWIEIYDGDVIGKTTYEVAPFMGAWIEIAAVADKR